MLIPILVDTVVSYLVDIFMFDIVLVARYEYED